MRLEHVPAHPGAFELDEIAALQIAHVDASTVAPVGDTRVDGDVPSRALITDLQHVATVIDAAHDAGDPSMTAIGPAVIATVIPAVIATIIATFVTPVIASTAPPL